MAPFDPYHKWLGIPETARPISKYRLLAIEEFESDRDVISAAAERQTVYLRMLQAGEHAVLVAKLLNEVSQARVTLLNADQKAEYDEELRRQQTPEPEAEPASAPTAVIQTSATSPSPVVVRGTVTQEFPVSIVQPDKRPRKRVQKKISKRPAVRGVLLVALIGVGVLFISMKFSGDAEPRILEKGLITHCLFDPGNRDLNRVGKRVAIEGAAPVEDRFGVLDNACGLNGVSDFVDVPLDKELAGPFSLSIWILMPESANGKHQSLISQHTKDGAENSSAVFNLQVQPDGQLDYFMGNGTDYGVSFPGPPVDQKKWSHLCVVFDGKEARLFLDAKETSKGPFMGSRLRSQQPIQIGRYWNNPQKTPHHFQGSVDDIRIYNRALSAAEVKALYDFESKPPASSIPTPSTTESITNTIGMTLNKIPAGTFMMGSPESETGRGDDETQHKVTLSKAFYMQTTEVTQGQWTAVMGTEPWKGKRSVKEGPNYPATHINWNDAVVFCKQLSAKESKTYRLPTEAEWEYACRAGAETRWSFGDDEKVLGDYAWYRENAYDIGEQYAHQVGQKKSNAFGLHDMHGNVFEWCYDYHGKDYYKESSEQDPTGPASGSFHVLRGGSWGDNSRVARSAFRLRPVAGHRHDIFGFRLVRELN